MKLTLFYILIVVAYLLGSISSAIIVCKLMGLPDPRTSGSKNPGATNVLRIGGKLPAILVLIGDMLKGFIPVMLARLFHIDGLALGILVGVAVIGHMFPVFFGFKGGKGVATSLGGILALSWQLGIVVLFIWAIVVAITRYVSLASMVALASAIVLNEWFGSTHYFMALVVIALIVIAKHHQNINNLIAGTERKFGM